MISTYRPIEQNAEIFLSNKQVKPNSPTTEKDAFSKVLAGTLDEIKFSKHAVKRLDERSLNLTPEQTKRLSEGVERAGEKGINDSLVLMDSMAFIVNVPSHTVVTALDGSQAMDKIFTNIDGAVII